MNTGFIIYIVCAAFCVFIFFYFKWYIKRRTSASELLEEYRTEVYRLIAEIDAATDRDSQLVEDRIKKLKSVLEETDKRLSVYTRELDRSRAGEVLYTSLGRGIRAALNTAPSASQPGETPQGASPAVASRQAVSPQAIPPQAALTVEPPPKPPKRQIRAQIETLVNEGVSAGEIASRLDISLAEVDLALNLLTRK